MESSGADNYQGPGKYRHYKGGEYEVLGIALGEDMKLGEIIHVIYRPWKKPDLSHLDDLDTSIVCDFWFRPLHNFNDFVEVTTHRDEFGQEYEEEGGELVRRFEKIADNSKINITIHDRPRVF